MIRRILGTILVVAGLSTTWAWGQVARLAGPAPAAAETPGMALYAAWQLDDAEQVSLFRFTEPPMPIISTERYHVPGR